MIDTPAAAAANPISQIERDTLATMTRTSWRYWLGLGAAASLVVARRLGLVARCCGTGWASRA